MTETIRLKKDEGIVEVLVSHRARASGTILLCSSSRRAGRIKGIFREAKTKIQRQITSPASVSLGIIKKSCIAKLKELRIRIGNL